MCASQVIKTKPGKLDFDRFEQLPEKLYEEDSPHFTLGHKPAVSHLEGCYLFMKNGEPVGRFAFYQNPNLKYKGKPTACIGSYECVDDQKTGAEILKYAKELARVKKFEWLIGPMEGSTWNSYRFSGHNRQPNFFMEPYHHIYYNDHFKQAGFQPIAAYISSIDRKLEFNEQHIREFEQAAKERRLTFRNLDVQDLEPDLYKIARFSIKVFSGNFLYTPITPEEFVTKYLKLKKFFDPELVWIIEDEKHQILAFVFAIQDYNGSYKNTIIIKSIARAPDTTLRGVGTYLVGKIYQIASRQGYKKIIHPFMLRENAPSLQISGKFSGKSFKSYHLYGLKL